MPSGSGGGAPAGLELEILKMDSTTLLKNLSLFLKHASKIGHIREHVEVLLPKVERALSKMPPSTNFERTWGTLAQELFSFLFGVLLLAIILGVCIQAHLIGSKSVATGGRGYH